jgi:ABC-type branched-subunit amino acid transport system substrate-binding protein
LKNIVANIKNKANHFLYGKIKRMYKFLALINLTVFLIIQVGWDSVQKIVTPKQEQETLKIGFVVAGERVTYPNGVEMAATEINHHGGLLGMPIELIGATTIASYNENRHPTKSAVIFTIKDGKKQFYKQIEP